MKVCYTAGQVKKLENCFSVSTNAVEIRIWFLTDDILRIRAGFDGDWDEASYSLTMTAWDSRTDELMKDCRKRVQTAAAELTDGDKQAVIQGSRLKVVVEKAPFRIMYTIKMAACCMQTFPTLLIVRIPTTAACTLPRSKPMTASMALAKNPARSTRLKST